VQEEGGENFTATLTKGPARAYFTMNGSYAYSQNKKANVVNIIIKHYINICPSS
jgi:hypothetical protein